MMFLLQTIQILISWSPSVALLGFVRWRVLSLTVTTTSSPWVFFSFRLFWSFMTSSRFCSTMSSPPFGNDLDSKALALFLTDQFLLVHRNSIGQRHWIYIQVTWCGHGKLFFFFCLHWWVRWPIFVQPSVCMWKVVQSTWYVDCSRLPIHTNNI